MSLDPKDFEYVSTLVLKRSAIVLEPEKKYLVESRLQPLACQHGLNSVADLVSKLRSGVHRDLTDRVVEAMTTNETSFFRDVNPFEAFRKVVLPDMFTKRANEKRLQIWCGASSTGQEPYTIAMILKEFFAAHPTWKLSIIATDLSTEVLEKARSASYTQLEVNRGLPASYLVKYFQREGAEWKVKDEVRKLIEFRQLNLIDSSWGITNIDIVFLRNVLIYFDVNTKKSILKRVRQILKPDGYLFLGGSETTMSLDDSYERIPYERSGCYKNQIGLGDKSMDLRSTEVIEVVRTIWFSLLNQEIDPYCDIEDHSDSFLTGFIQITGAWNGAVVCTTSERLVRQVASILFGFNEDSLTADLLQDALAELTNMVGGNLKALLPGPSYLCLPAVIEGEDYSVSVRATHPVLEVSFRKDSEPFLVKLLCTKTSLRNDDPLLITQSSV